MEAYLKLKERISLGAQPLSAVWEDTLAPSLNAYLLSQQVQVSLLNSRLIGVAGETSLLLLPSSWSESSTTLVGQVALDAALGCRSTLVENGFDDVHVIILESVFSFFHSKGLYEPTITANPVGVICESFSTSLGISICPAESPNLEWGTGGFYFLQAWCSVPLHRETRSLPP